MEKVTIHNSKSYSLSFENSRRILEQQAKIDSFLKDVVYRHFDVSEKQITQEINELLIKTAEETGQSLYDICFHTVPDIEREEPDWNNPSPEKPFLFGYTLTLKPVIFELEQGPGYWKGKYYELKRRMRELIDGKEP